MAKRTSDKPKFDLHQTITNQIVTMLENCTDPWKRPWISAGRSLATPINASTRRAYRGTNVVMLWGAAQAAGYQSPEWMSYEQAFQMGGGKKDGTSRFAKVIQPSTMFVRPGEKGTMIVYAKKFEKDENKPDDKGGFMLRYSTVFNVEQIEGYEHKPVKLPDLVERSPEAEEFFRHMLANYQEGSDRAYYSPSLDHIRMPSPEQFRNTSHGTAFEHFYSTRAHETAHWTGHESRLNRDMTGSFGSKKYAREELIAELTAAFVCAHLGISATPREDHAVYIKSWIKALKNDKKEIFSAATAAQKAMDFMLAKQPATVDEEVDEAEVEREEELIAA
jgi:antirestriction protein ArdC